jgi:hypothetical protein
MSGFEGAPSCVEDSDGDGEDNVDEEEDPEGVDAPDEESYVVKVGLAGILKEEARLILPLIEKLVLVGSRIAVEASMLVTCHVLKVLGRGGAVAPLTQTTFYRASVLVSQFTGHEMPFKDPDLLETYEQIYSPSCPPDHVRPIREPYMRQAINYYGAEAVTSFKNHVAIHFEKRHQKHIWLLLEGGDEGSLRTYCAGLSKLRKHNICRLVSRSTRSHSTIAQAKEHFVSVEGVSPFLPTGSTPLTAEVEAALEGFSTDLRQRIGPLPAWENRISAHPERYLPYMREMLKAREAWNETAPDKEKVRLFSMTPQKHVRASFASIDSAVLRAMVKKAYGGAVDVSSLSNSEVWARFVSVSGVQKVGRTFGNFVKTDGVAACVVMKRPVRVEEDDCTGEEGGEEDKGSEGGQAGQGAKKGKGKISDAGSPSEGKGQPRRKGKGGGKWTKGKKKKKKRKKKKKPGVPRGGWQLDLTGKRVVAIDPRIISVVSGVVYDPERLWMERSDTFAMSEREFYHMAGYHLRTRKTSVWEKRVEIDEYNRGVPAGRTSRLAEYTERVCYVLKHIESVMSFYTARRFRSLSWNTYIKKQRAIDQLCRLITGGRDDTVVAFGDGDVYSGNGRGIGGPCETLKRRLERVHCRRGSFVEVDECRTSVVCSTCDGPLTPAKKRKPDGTTSDVYSVRLCTNTGCRIGWNRDVNAARNILKVFLEANQGRARPMALRRPANGREFM